MRTRFLLVIAIVTFSVISPPPIAASECQQRFSVGVQAAIDAINKENAYRAKHKTDLADMEYGVAKQLYDSASHEYKCASDKDQKLYRLLDNILNSSPIPTFEDDVAELRFLHSAKLLTHDPLTEYLIAIAASRVKDNLILVHHVLPSPDVSDKQFDAHIALMKLFYYQAMQRSQNGRRVAQFSPSPPPCAIPNANAAIRGVAVEPNYPEIAREMGATGTTEAKVTLDASGAVIAVEVYQSAGNPALDRATVAAASETSYLPAIVNWSNVPGTYIFRHEFTGV